MQKHTRNSEYNNARDYEYNYLSPTVYILLGECIALWGEPNELSIQHRVYIFMQYVDSKLAK